MNLLAYVVAGFSFGIVALVAWLSSLQPRKPNPDVVSYVRRHPDGYLYAMPVPEPEVIIQSRLHFEDMPGEITGDASVGWLSLPMTYESKPHSSYGALVERRIEREWKDG